MRSEKEIKARLVWYRRKHSEIDWGSFDYLDTEAVSSLVTSICYINAFRWVLEEEELLTDPE